MGWNDGLTRPVTLSELGQRYRQYRLADPDAEEAMAGSLRRWGQLSPVVACVRAGKFELIDGFKRYAAAGQVRELTSLSVRVLEVDEPTAKAASEVIIYSVRLEEITRHPLVPRTQTGLRQLIKTHHPVDDPIDRTRLLRERFGELGPVALQFLDGLLAKQIQGKLQAQQLLALIAHYQRDDVGAAFERAVRFGAFSLAAIRRILAANAKPKQWPGELANLHDTLPPSLREDPIGPRPASDYQQLLLPEEPSHEAPSQEEKPGGESDPDQPKPA